MLHLPPHHTCNRLYVLIWQSLQSYRVCLHLSFTYSYLLATSFITCLRLYFTVVHLCLVHCGEQGEEQQSLLMSLWDKAWDTWAAVGERLVHRHAQGARQLQEVLKSGGTEEVVQSLVSAIPSQAILVSLLEVVLQVHECVCELLNLSMQLKVTEW